MWNDDRMSEDEERRILKDTLRSLQRVVDEVDTGPGPEAPQPAEPAAAQAQSEKAAETRPGDVTGEAAEETAPAAETDVPVVQWYSSPSEPSPLKAAAHRQAAIRPDDVPVLEDVVVAPGWRRAPRMRAPAPAAERPISRQFDVEAIPEVCDKMIRFLENELWQATGQVLDPDTRAALRRRLGAALSEWAERTERRLRETDE